MLLEREELSNHQLPSLSALDRQIIGFVGQGGNWQDIPEEVPSARLAQIREMTKERGIVRTTYYGRLRWDQPAYTIATYFNRPGNGTNIHPWEHRTLSCREAARLQSFPDSYSFLGTEASVRKQIGNAVPPLLAYAVGKALGRQTYIDLFAGAGGLSYGLELSGMQGILVQELDKSAAATHRDNMPSIATIGGDIRDNSVREEVIWTARQRLAGEQLGLLCGGPPCQGFSTAGWRNLKDDRNALVTYFLLIVGELKPKYVLIENVEGLLNMDKGRVLREIQAVLSDLGYLSALQPWLLNAEEYGVPQMRRRVFIVAAQDGLPLPAQPAKYFDKCYGRRETAEQRKSPRLQYPVTVAEALWDLPPLTSRIDEYYPGGEPIDAAYSDWCRGRLSAPDFLMLRGKSQVTSSSALSPLQLDLGF